MLLTTQHLSLDHQKDLRNLVQDLNLIVNPGDKVAIIGEEGNGKSSLLQALMDSSLVAHYLLMTGTIQRNFHSFIYIPQSISQEMAELTLNDYFFEDTDINLDYGLLYLYAEQLQFDSNRFASQQIIASLSGGEKLKIQLIKSLASPAELIFLDEPSNDLDLDTLLWLENYIITSSQAIIFVSHDEDFLAKTATKVIHLESVKKKTLAQTQVRQVDYQNYSRQRQEAYQKQKQQAQNDRKEFDKVMAKHLRQKSQVRDTLLKTHDATLGRLIAKKMKNVLSHEKRYEKMKENLTQVPFHEDTIALFFSDISPLPSRKQLLQYENFKLEIGDQILAKQIHFYLNAQDKIGIIGSNGIGKSTFLNILYQQLSQRPDIILGYMPQHYEDLLDESVSPLTFLSPQGNREQEQIILTHLASLQFTRQEVHHKISELSGGQKAKLLLLKMVLDRANFLLLDEPSRNFSPTSQPYIRQLFTNYSGGLVCVSHDRRFLREVCNKIYRLTEKGLEEIELENLE
ncbi:ATP-binding cassette domain-containing protein [Streptococcus ruminantium]|uniref:ATP-binding cassette domain-containing protein n=3 Tax=Streptococcus ruminantium TaxID=1917441 RepID=A0ABU1B3H4_9STRE|nr:ATP-binding cassette domain-containing protein [Streptococcus ruminantium]MDQ8758800.1 ATP-binding cassette domain-containing protein [Streptococcus ruminantium]MDQ8768282.1 ATP-binding cassette domain-containing protein [Streptococcus ruminantium]MDQ8774638.1 ATP-binding cassette domain-containing protein [Streptococcus ruminantium]MDQ8794797.1 ATP-binding cassette domain-containing protein [Streptococcus ruminantium]MDQ8795515.1 ATP-binding cassette domain-containing protein [Streptococcu